MKKSFFLASIFVPFLSYAPAEASNMDKIEALTEEAAKDILTSPSAAVGVKKLVEDHLDKDLKKDVDNIISNASHINSSDQTEKTAATLGLIQGGFKALKKLEKFIADAREHQKDLPSPHVLAITGEVVDEIFDNDREKDGPGSAEKLTRHIDEELHKLFKHHGKIHDIMKKIEGKLHKTQPSENSNAAANNPSNSAPTTSPVAVPSVSNNNTPTNTASTETVAVNQ